MTVEEKAKAYDEAYKEVAVRFGSNVADEIFLKESEDERIRKNIITYLKQRRDRSSSIPAAIGSWIAWLEKQGEQKSHEERIDEINRKVFPNHYDGYAPVLETEQKPADKVEPRFKVGDWIINGIDVCKIKNIDLNEFNYIFENGISDISLVDNICHLWTIQDAKDGDILSYRNGQWIFIYKEKIDDKSLYYHALYSTIQDLTIANVGFTLLDDAITPATKEQRDTLMKAITDVGYEWDDEKKELKKINQKPTDDKLPEFKDKLCELFQRFRWYKDEPPTNGDILEYIDAHIQELLAIVNKQKPITPKFKINDVIKYNQKQWTIIGIDINNHCYDLDNDECVDFDTADYNFELVEQKTTEWSEEDERLRTSCIKHIEEELERIRNDKYGHSEIISDLKESCRERINWLKSLRPQNRWKPSEGQPH